MPKRPTAPRTTAAFTIDSSPYSAVVVCNLAHCAWRGAAHTKALAYRLVAAHLDRVHGEHRRAAECRTSARNASRTLAPAVKVVP